MTKSFHSAARATIRESEPSVPNLELEVLNSVATPKEWASALSVTDRQVRLWATGEKDIPPFRKVQIVKQAKTFLKAYRLIEDEIDECLRKAYGNSDKGRF
jgi:hypothetical protein